MAYQFSRRMQSTHKSLIREILKLTATRDVISLAGGLPHPDLFPIQEIEAACQKVLRESGRQALQYATTEGYPPLREWIAKRYRTQKGLEIKPDDILIISGSQQGLDFLGRILIDEGDPILVERPGYLGAFHSFSLCCPTYRSVELREDGIDTAALGEILAREPIKFFYGVPNFQNPSGISYSAANRQKVAEVMKRHDTLYVEDDPYGELRFAGEPAPSMRYYLGDQAILLGSFSKIVAPGFRVGWVVAAPEIMEKLVIVKQASDLHTDYFAQRVLYQYVIDNDLDAHIEKIKALYRRNREYMMAMIERYLPKDIRHTVPEGGMFLWMILPEGSDTTELLRAAIDKGVAFVPGAPFYATGGGERYLRVSFSYVTEQQIEEGIKRLALAIQETLG